ncbi:acyl-CoA dehydrogenase [Burkholderia sp. SRS-W-2-2016]|uniref:acyl-CoA/acyl-ACP dehydrogenase n=1 Tax=Burkholderia sp. SRS-W-2-2016 TaxID=1926878 RepID=UPI00094B4606|nr:acyl-CoA/acyl-ACP dehydrogenase [Burkholderia sp. SRS-W-2-2016]OLL30829.1 acyl-CoA dehydrogenase [Burkholderia sp. SRS-W-2-2016]
MLDTRDHAPSFPAQSPQRSHEPEAGRAPREPCASGRAAALSQPATSLAEFLRDARFDPNDPYALGAMLATLIAHGYDREPGMPLPGHGRTLARWRSLAAVAACDLGLVKLFEGHTDALAILAELDGPPAPDGSRWAVWAAEPPQARVQATTHVADADRTGIRTIDGERADSKRSGGEHAHAERLNRGHNQLRLTGTKAWCSGAQSVTHALITAWLDDEPVLAAVAMDQPSITIDTSNWQAVGMQATASADVHFDASAATLIGASHAYVRRPGFWHGGAGIAACWYGAAARIGGSLRDACAQRADPLRLAQLGATDVALQSAAAVLRETAAWIDTHPNADAQTAALRARLAVEQAADTVMHHATRALGAGPLCRDARFARALADLPVFLRQSHAERDLAALGEQLLAASAQPPNQLSLPTDTQWLL